MNTMDLSAPCTKFLEIIALHPVKNIVGDKPNGT